MKCDAFFTKDGFPDEERFGKNVYHLLHKKQLEEIAAGLRDGKEAPSLLLHSCCGPCSSAVITKLAPFFKITVFYYNPNIDTAGEYRRRADTQKKLLDSLHGRFLQSGGQEASAVPFPVSYIEEAFDNTPFLAAAIGFEGEPEGGERCARCFTLRLDKTAAVAARGGFDFFCTTLTVSPMKNAPLINRIGSEAAKQSGCAWLYSDFKKENGYLLSINLSKRFDLYRQEYCGCVFSKNNAGAHRTTR